MKYEINNISCLDYKREAGFSLIYLDPPYSFKEEDKYFGVGDNLHEYLTFMFNVLSNLKTLLLTDSNIIVHVDYKVVHNIKVLMDSIFGRENFKNEIIWCYSSPATVMSHLPRKHDNLLWYSFGDYPFNPERINHSAKMNVGGKTAWSKEKIPWEYYREKGKLLEDWWTDIPSLCRNEKEKTGYATQKPLALLKRVVKMFSNEEQWVLDPFMGSGTTLEASMLTRRNSAGCDINAHACEIVEKRMNNIEEDLFS